MPLWSSSNISQRYDLSTTLAGLQLPPSFLACGNSPGVRHLSLPYFKWGATYSIFRTSVKDVQAAVKCGANTQTPVVARSGGHSYAAYGVGGQDGALVIDLSGLKAITYANDHQQAAVQTGNRLGDVGVSLWNNGKRALPHGTCPNVGSGGHTSYGGYGPFSRFGGLLVDRVVSAEVVLANSTVIMASKDSNPDLFWVRGSFFPQEPRTDNVQGSPWSGPFIWHRHSMGV
jgi:FAD/FMN-containing dehydrogenase